MLCVLAWIYLGGGARSFMVMYLVLIIVSILFDIIYAAELPSFANMTPGEAFGAYVWCAIFAFKPLIVLTMVLYDRLEISGAVAGSTATDGHAWTRFNDAGQPGGEYYDDDEN